MFTGEERYWVTNEILYFCLLSHLVFQIVVIGYNLVRNLEFSVIEMEAGDRLANCIWFLNYLFCFCTSGKVVSY